MISKLLALTLATVAQATSLIFLAEVTPVENLIFINPAEHLMQLATCDAKSMIKRHEGVRTCVYKDTMGYRTIGVGFNLDQGSARSTCQRLGIDYNAVLSGSKCLTNAQVDSLLSVTMQSAISNARSVVSSYGSQCCNV